MNLVGRLTRHQLSQFAQGGPNLITPTQGENFLDAGADSTVTGSGAVTFAVPGPE